MRNSAGQSDRGDAGRMMRGMQRLLTLAICGNTFVTNGTVLTHAQGADPQRSLHVAAPGRRDHRGRSNASRHSSGCRDARPIVMSAKPKE